MIVITGGSGCGKSVVSQLLRVMGYPVYDCDREARRLMTDDPDLRHALADAFGAETFLADGSLNKPYLATRIFGDAERLAQMNALVHPAVARDIMRRNAIERRPLFVETAIYYESGFGQLIPSDRVWCIAAPLELRIDRAIGRDHTTREKVLARIGSQMPQEEKIKKADAVIWNDSTHSLIEQVNEILREEFGATRL